MDIRETQNDLHSTMFLLIQCTPDYGGIIDLVFTFHNVSINTELTGDRTLLLIDLHSTMFLLIPVHGIQSIEQIRIYIPQCFY